jgi:hypothetical protein
MERKTDSSGDVLLKWRIHAEVSTRYILIPAHFPQIAFPNAGMAVAIDSSEGLATEELAKGHICNFGVSAVWSYSGHIRIP